MNRAFREADLNTRCPLRSGLCARTHRPVARCARHKWAMTHGRLRREAPLCPWRTAMPPDADRAPLGSGVFTLSAPVSLGRPAIPLRERYDNRTRCSDSGLRRGCRWRGCRRSQEARGRGDTHGHAAGSVTHRPPAPSGPRLWRGSSTRRGQRSHAPCVPSTPYLPRNNPFAHAGDDAGRRLSNPGGPTT